MTSEEIKATYSMRNVVERYGFQPNRAGFIHCPFHGGDREPSLKVYDRDFHCHACGAHGDIFEYQKPTFSSRLAVYRAQKQRSMRQKEADREREKRRLNNRLISVYRAYMERSEPLSDVWCDCYNALQYQLYVQAELSGLEARW